MTCAPWLVGPSYSLVKQAARVVVSDGPWRSGVRGLARRVKRVLGGESLM